MNMKKFAVLLTFAILLACLPVTGTAQAALGISPSTRQLVVGERIRLTIVGDTGDNDIRWVSSDSTIASVNRNGFVLARAPGRAVIRARVGSVRISRTITVTAATDPTTLRGALEPIFGHVGVAAYNYHWSETSQLRGNTLSFIKRQYNSLTAENEMKPDFLLSNTTITASEAKRRGYIIPSGWNDTTRVPAINVERIENYLKLAHDNNLKVRFHTLVWYSQTPDWFFRVNYSQNGAYVSRTEMNRRLEFYVKSIINIIHTGAYSDVVYAYDVVNEYITNKGKGGWGQVYGEDEVYIRSAFRHAHDQLTALGKRNNVSLFYNDYNTYENAAAIVSLINGINRNAPAGVKYCDGIGMQMHLDVSYPSINSIRRTIRTFRDAGFEIQITELDVTINFHRSEGHTLTDQSRYYGDLFTMLIEEQCNGANITSITFWGLWDSVSWRSAHQPLIFTGIDRPKSAFTAIMNAANANN